MLLATYQPAYESFDAMMKSKRYEADDLGFNPMWCMPITSPADLFAESMLCNPNKPEIFFIIDADMWLRVDKLENYRQMRDGKGKRIKDLIVPEGALPDRHCEFVVPMEQIKNRLLMCPIIQDYRKFDMIPASEEGLKTLRPAVWQSARRALEHRTRSVKVYAAPGMELSGCSEKEYSDAISVYLHYKMAFECSVLVFMASYVMEKQAETSLLYAVSNDFAAYHKLQNDYYTWLDEDGSAAGYDYLYEQAKRMVIDSPPVIKALYEGRKPGRNDLCPCGSGKKFKKCHGIAGYTVDPIWGDGAYLDRLSGY